MKTFLAIAATLIMVSQATVASAQSGETIKVSYADLNLQSPQGLEQLDRRIHYAARTVCGHDSAFDLASRIAAGRCETKAQSDAHAQFASMTAIHIASR